jgi:ribosome biogenesis GTPase A
MNNIIARVAIAWSCRHSVKVACLGVGGSRMSARLCAPRSAFLARRLATMSQRHLTTSRTICESQALLPNVIPDEEVKPASNNSGGEEALGKCPGCGVQLQRHDPQLAGYVPVRQSDSEISAETDKKPRGRARRKSSDKHLSDEDYERIVAGLPEELRNELLHIEEPEILEAEVSDNSTKQTETTEDKVNNHEEASDSAATDKETASDVQTMDETEQEADLTDTPPKPPPLICQRCHSLQYHRRLPEAHNMVWGEGATIADVGSLSFLRKRHDAIVVLVVDLFDFPGSVPVGIADAIGDGNPVVVVVNKTDILPSDAHLNRVRTYITDHLQRMRLRRVVDVFLVSARTGFGIKNMLQGLRRLRHGREDIYLVGSANVGKSALVNAIIRAKRYEKDGDRRRMTTSPIPGTTLATLGIPFSELGGVLDPLPERLKSRWWASQQRHLFDTPGVLAKNQLIYLLEPSEMSLTVPKRRVLPLNYRFMPGKWNTKQYTVIIKTLTNPAYARVQANQYFLVA